MPFVFVSFLVFGTQNMFNDIMSFWVYNGIGLFPSLVTLIMLWQVDIQINDLVTETHASVQGALLTGRGADSLVQDFTQVHH